MYLRTRIRHVELRFEDSVTSDGSKSTKYKMVESADEIRLRDRLLDALCHFCTTSGCPTDVLPSARRVLGFRGNALHKLIMESGGYEQVARMIRWEYRPEPVAEKTSKHLRSVIEKLEGYVASGELQLVDGRMPSKQDIRKLDSLLMNQIESLPKGYPQLARAMNLEFRRHGAESPNELKTSTVSKSSKSSNSSNSSNSSKQGMQAKCAEPKPSINPVISTQNIEERTKELRELAKYPARLPAALPTGSELLAFSKSLISEPSNFVDRDAYLEYWNNPQNIQKHLHEIQVALYDESSEHEWRANDFHPRVMPRLKTLSYLGHRNIVLAVTRNGGYEMIADKLGLMYYPDWKYLHELLWIIRTLRVIITKLLEKKRQQLNRYVESGRFKLVAHGGKISVKMPSVQWLAHNGYERMCRALVKHGGPAVVYSRLGVYDYHDPDFEIKPVRNPLGLNWGWLDLDTAERLLCLSIQHGTIRQGLACIFSKDELLQHGAADIIEKLDEHNLSLPELASRLGLVPPANHDERHENQR